MPKEYTLIGGNGTRVSPLEVTESGTYEAGDSRAFNPVKVNVPSGSSTLSGLTDVDISNPTDGQVLVYDATSEKWENGSGGLVLVHFDGETFTMDKTWQEVRDAIVSEKIVYYHRISQDGIHAAETSIIIAAYEDNGEYAVVATTRNGILSVAYCNSANDYPVLD